jgi:hypothetical protein
MQADNGQPKGKMAAFFFLEKYNTAFLEQILSSMTNCFICDSSIIS